MVELMVSDSEKIICLALSQIKALNHPDNVTTEIHDYCMYYLFQKPGVRGPFPLALMAFMLTGSRL